MTSLLLTTTFKDSGTVVALQQTNATLFKSVTHRTTTPTPSKLRKHPRQSRHSHNERTNTHINLTACLARSTGWVLAEQAACAACGVDSKQGGICRAWRGGGSGSKPIGVVA
jgi:hypothetical protein